MEEKFRNYSCWMYKEEGEGSGKEDGFKMISCREEGGGGMKGFKEYLSGIVVGVGEDSLS